MQWFSKRLLAMTVLAMASLAGCGGSDISEPVTDPGVDAGGLNFVVSGAGYSTASGALPTPDATLAPPTVSITGTLSALSSAQLNVGAAEPFQTVLLLPVGATSYARVAMPGSAQLIGITTKRNLLSSFVAVQLQVAIVRAGKVSPPTTVSLLTPIN